MMMKLAKNNSARPRSGMVSKPPRMRSLTSNIEGSVGSVVCAVKEGMHVARLVQEFDTWLRFAV